MPTTADPRVLPLVALDPVTITSMFAPITGGTSLGAITSVGGGLVNTVFRVTTRDGERYALRILAGAPQGERLAAELRLLDRLRDVVPVPAPIVIDERGTQCGFPFVIYRWIDGITLNECRRAQGAGTMETLAEPLGRLAAMVATARVTEEKPALRRVSVRDSIDRADAELASARVRERLGQARANGLRVRLTRLTDALPALDRHAGLVHGDFGGRKCSRSRERLRGLGG